MTVCGGLVEGGITWSRLSATAGREGEEPSAEEADCKSTRKQHWLEAGIAEGRGQQSRCCGRGGRSYCGCGCVGYGAHLERLQSRPRMRWQQARGGGLGPTHGSRAGRRDCFCHKDSDDEGKERLRMIGKKMLRTAEGGGEILAVSPSRLQEPEVTAARGRSGRGERLAVLAEAGSGRRVSPRICCRTAHPSEERGSRGRR
ncbi:hypothetical protein B296_00031518 [Ensete ventricosum]|uniref:Uncharacterized protein n=1 Tax=Ensete ventricosum TaxID=4639 RepID=A0A427AG21_ENSVE|nr:hypothetical protein B296_00031518 [Ensete ventricosum]